MQVGIIGGTHGIRGEVRVQPTSDFEEDRLGKPGIKHAQHFTLTASESLCRWIRPQTQGLIPQKSELMKIESLGGRPHIYKGHALWILQFKGIQTPEEVQSYFKLLISDLELKAAKLKGYHMLMNPTERQQLPQDEYYIQQLIGLKVLQKV